MDPEFDVKKYGELLAQALPVVIDNLEDHERLLTAAEALMDKGEDLSNEERKLLELLVVLVEIFEHEVEEADDQPAPRAVHHQHLAAGFVAQAGVQRQAHHGSGTAAV